MVDGPDGLTVVEAKSSATPASSLLDGVKGVRPHVQDLRPRCDAAVVYGGEEAQQRTHGRLVPWRLVRSAAPPRTDPCVRVFAGDRPLAGADVRVELPDGMRKSAETDERGVAAFDVRPGHLPLTVGVAREGFAAHREPAWIPDERALHVRLTAEPGGGPQVREPVR